MWRTFYILLLVPRLVFAGFEQTEVGARAKALGSSFVGLANDVWAISYNVGGLANLTQREAAVFYAPTQFGLSELSLSAFAVGYPTDKGVFGISARRFGFDLYREVSWTLSYANTFHDVALGVNLNYHNVAIQNYGSAGTIGFDVGALVHLTSQVQWGISAKNINAPTIGSSREPLPQSFSTGIAYLPLEKLSLSLDYFKETKFDASSRFGAEYWVVDEVALRFGISNEPTLYAGGFGIQYNIFEFDYAFTTHQELGVTHQFSLLIRW